MRAPWLLLAPLAAPLLFLGSADAAILPPCCVAQGETHPGDPPHLRNSSPFLVPADARRPYERALEATAEAPIPVEVPPADAIGFALQRPPEANEPLREPERARIVEQPPLQIDNDYGAPCCQVDGETHPPDNQSKDTLPVLVGAEVRRGYDRALEAAAEVVIPARAPRVDAIGIPLGQRPGVSEPAHLPAGSGDRPSFKLIIALLVILLAIGSWLVHRHRRRRLKPDPLTVPVSRTPLPKALLPANPAPLPLFKPVTALAGMAAAARELEPA